VAQPPISGLGSQTCTRTWGSSRVEALLAVMKVPAIPGHLHIESVGKGIYQLREIVPVDTKAIEQASFRGQVFDLNPAFPGKGPVNIVVRVHSLPRPHTEISSPQPGHQERQTTSVHRSHRVDGLVQSTPIENLTADSPRCVGRRFLSQFNASSVQTNTLRGPAGFSHAMAPSPGW